MIKQSKVLDAIKKIAPEGLQEDWDNSGIQINVNPDKDVKKLLTCLEISDAVVAEAVRKGADMILTHHPLIFGKISRVDAEDVIGNQIVELIKHDISVYSSHTAFDSAAHGTNQYLAEQIGLEDVVPLIAAADEYAGCGMGRVGRYISPLDFSDFYKTLERVCGGKDGSEVRVAGKVPAKVAKVALCTGAGAEFIDKAAALGCDAYITGDVKYHDARHADDIGLCVIDAGHYGTEVVFAKNMAAQLEHELGGTLEILVSETNINPFIDIASV
jgi:GTP cyclohydrolase I